MNSFPNIRFRKNSRKEDTERNAKRQEHSTQKCKTNPNKSSNSWTGAEITAAEPVYY
jgi:hypothetical protein